MLRRKDFGLAVVLFAFFAAHVAAQTTRSSDAQLDELAQKISEKHSLPGMIVAMIDDSGVTAIGAAGVRKAGDPTPIGIEDRIHLGSCTKAMTATLMAILVEDEVLRWDSTIGEVMPKLRGVIHDDYLGVTLEQLLDHRGGLPANAKNWWAQGDDPISTRTKILSESLTSAPKSVPGAKFEYSNLGYLAAAHMAETKLDRPWEEIIRQKMIIPLGMVTSGFGPPNTKDQVDQPWGHHAQPRAQDDRKFKPVQQDNAPALGPAGTVHCSIEDWAKFLAWHLQPDQHPKLASAAAIEKLHVFNPADQGKIQSYCGGWIVTEKNSWNSKLLAHSGSNTAWMATVHLIPEQDVGFVVVTNYGAPVTRQATQEAMAGLTDIYNERLASKLNELP
jgi:CubicO group peptidase (beta-lactamase class C family)